MRVVLLHDVTGVGKAGELVNVADGYGRNFLLPRKLAILASEGVVRTFEMQQKVIQRRADRERRDAESVANRLAAHPITIEARTGVGGKLYGSVTTQDIADRVREELGIELDRRHIELHEPIRLVGSYTVPVRFVRGVVAQLTVNVTEPGGQVPPPAAEATAEEAAPAPAPETDSAAVEAAPAAN
ncbi:MAG: 50S ribosomal protein L9 [Armatimonadota bacterium]|nr:50S ribosomal protein L9 [Armatimonadota bacterium]